MKGAIKMSANSFIKSLKKHLWMQMSSEEIKENIAKYGEFFSQSEDESEAVKSCGDVRLIAEELIHPHPFINHIRLRIALLILMLPFAYIYVNMGIYAEISPIIYSLGLMLQLIIIGSTALGAVKITTAQQNKFLRILIMLTLLAVAFITLRTIYTGSLLDEYISSKAFENLIVSSDYSPPKESLAFIYSLVHGQYIALVMSVILAVSVLRLGRKVIPLMLLNLIALNVTTSILKHLSWLDLSATSVGDIYSGALSTIAIDMLILAAAVALCFLCYFAILRLYRRMKDDSTT